VCFLGGPASGKTVLATRLLDSMAPGAAMHLSTGELLRTVVAAKSHPRWLMIDTHMRDGEPVPDSIVYELLSTVVAKFRVHQHHAVCTVVLDGFPLTPPQRKMLARTLGPVGMVFHCDCPPTEMMARAGARAAETRRSDDGENTVARRIVRFEEKCGPVLHDFGADGVLHRVSTSGCTVAQSFSSVMGAWTARLDAAVPR
jgi:adenylate kinase family enzyme